MFDINHPAKNIEVLVEYLKSIDSNEFAYREDKLRIMIHYYPLFIEKRFAKLVLIRKQVK